MEGVLLGGGIHSINYYDVITIENLFFAWKDFRKGKRSKKDVSKFEVSLEDNLFQLHEELKEGNWKPHKYTQFYISDPKLRRIHKATVRDRILYQAIYRKIYPVFDKAFIHDSYSSRNLKGTHKGVKRCETFIKKESRNFSRPVFALKCDIRKFFDSVDHEILFNLISKKISDGQLLHLIRQILASYESSNGRGLPLGNVTSQVFANIYLNELDQFVKHKLKASYYIRYCDDFVIVSCSKNYLEWCVKEIRDFCKKSLLLDLNPNKVHIRKIIQGIDFLGYVVMSHYKIVRPKTVKRILKKIQMLKNNYNFELGNRLSSYFAVLNHAKSKKIFRKIKQIVNNL